MRRFFLMLLCVLLLTGTAAATDVTAQQAQMFGADSLSKGLDRQTKDLLEDVSPTQTGNFGSQLWKLITDVLSSGSLGLGEAVKTMGALLCVVALCALCRGLEGVFSFSAVRIVGALGVALVCTTGLGAMVQLAGQTLDRVGNFTTLLLPVLSSVMTASGGMTSGAAIYVGSSLFFDILVRLIRGLLTPLVYAFLALSTAECAAGQGHLKPVKDLIAWVIRLSLKAVMSLFTAYLGLTSLVTGGADEAALKAAKAAFSGVVPVVGGIISDASETVLAGASLLKNAVGIYGLLAVLAIGFAPFLRIGVQLLALKLTTALSGMVGGGELTDLLTDLSSAMGFLLGMTGSCMLMAMFSCCCFLKAVGS